MQEVAGKKPLISIVVLSWNKLEDTKKCIKAIRQLIYPNYELVIVDNGSTDGSKEYLAKLDNIIYVDNAKNRGFTGGHIDGLRHATGEYILILNNDALIAPDYLDVAIQHFNDSCVAAVGGRAYVWNDKHPAYDQTGPYYAFQNINPHTGEGIFQKIDSGYPEVVNTLSGSCVLLRRTVIEKYGYFYQPFFAYFEETDLFARMKRAGYKIIYDPKLHIWHEGGKSSTSYYQFHQLLRNRLIFGLRNFQTAYLPVFIKNYIKLGMPCLWRQFQHNDYQIMHRAYARAFLRSLFSWPKYLLSRLVLNNRLGRSHYNLQIKQEQASISLVCDTSDLSIAELRKVIHHWLPVMQNNPRHELVLVTKQAINKLPIPQQGDLPLIRIVRDAGMFPGQSLNLGWLCAAKTWLYFDVDLASPDKTDFSVMERVVASAKSYNYLGFQTAGAKSAIRALINRSVLERSGGFPGPTASYSAADYIYQYAKLSGKGKLLEFSDRHVASYRALPRLADDTLAYVVRSAIHQDQTAFDEHGRWQKFLAKHRHAQQLFNLIHWAYSSKIALRLKLGRAKKILLACLTLNRKALATQLQHIKNEILKVYGLNRYFHIQNATTEKILDHRIAASQWGDIPVFIICRDRLEPLLILIKSLRRLGLSKIVLVDNDSAFPPLLDFYAKTDFQVCNTGRNVGHTSPWSSGFIKTLIPDDFYIVTDPDVIPVEDCPANALSYLLALHKKYFWHQKIGFGLKIDDLPEHYILKDKVIAWENQFWKNPISNGIYEAPLDTTLALYKPFNYKYFLIPSIRTGHPYEVRHLPWYVNSARVSPEETYYRERANSLVTTWSGDELHERYLREIERMQAAESTI